LFQFVCPECGDLGCGVTVAVQREGSTITWSDFRWEVNWFDPENPDAFTKSFELGPFRFDYNEYAGVLNRAQLQQPAAG
jgi:hypothetical protein